MSQYSIPNTSTTAGNLTTFGSLPTSSLYNPTTGTGSGPIAFDPSALPTSDAKRAEIIDYIRMRLADGIVDVELDLEHYNMGINQALIKYRQRAANSVEESYAFLDLLPETQEYILPKEIKNVRAVFRRGIGSVTGTTASQFEPFASGYMNTYMLTAGRVGGLTNYELFVDYQKLAMRMFGGFMNFYWNKVTKKLTLVRKQPFGGTSASNQIAETVMLHVFNYKPDLMLLNDPQVFPWIQDYAYALTLISIGNAREKFQSIAGPSGQITLNGNDLKASAKEDLERLEREAKRPKKKLHPMIPLLGEDQND